MLKQVILYRRDLKMRKGKIAAQCAHASVGAVLSCIDSDEYTAWNESGHTKIVLSVEGLEAMLAAYGAAGGSGLPLHLVTDLGHTEFHGVPTVTALAIGPAPSEAIDVITGRSGLVETKLA